MDLQYSDTPVASFAMPAPLAAPFRVDDVRLVHLRGEDAVAAVLHLRDEIDLSVHTAAGAAEFQRVEKKETSWGSSSVSSTTAH